jgi:cell division protein FtsB
MGSLRLDIAETLEALALARGRRLERTSWRLWHGADTLRWIEARELVDEQLDIEELEEQRDALEEQIEDLRANVREALRSIAAGASVEALHKAFEAAIE